MHYNGYQALFSAPAQLLESLGTRLSSTLNTPLGTPLKNNHAIVLACNVLIQTWESIVMPVQIYNAIYLYSTITTLTCMHCIIVQNVCTYGCTVCITYDKIVPGQQIHKTRSFRAFVRTITSQSCYRSYRYPYALVLM